jgi:hypothetical protein
MTTNTVDPAQPTASTVVVATDGSVTVTQVSNATTVTYPGVFATPFSPLDLSPTLWLDASDETTITESGGAVSQWDDKSGNGYDLTQATGTYQPKTGTATINSLNTMEFDALNSQYLGNSSVPFSGTSYTMFAVYEINPSDTTYIVSSFDTLGVYAYVATSGSGVTSLHAAVTDTSLYVDGVEFTGTTRGEVFTAIGTAPAVVRATFTSTSTDGFSAGYPSTNQFSFGSGTKVAEIIVVGSPTAQEISDTETYLANKWGITL